MWYWKCFRGVLQIRDPLVALNLLFERERNGCWSYCSPSSPWGVIKQSDIELVFSETDSNSSLRSHWTCQVRFKTDISVLFWLMFLKFEFEFDEFSHSLHKMPCILFLDECDFSSLVPFNVLKLKRWNTGLYFHIK